MALQQQDLENEIAVNEETHRLESLAEEAHLLQLEEVRSQPGSDYESEDEDPVSADVTKPRTNIKAVDSVVVATGGNEVRPVSHTPVEKTAEQIKQEENYELLRQYQQRLDANMRPIQKPAEPRQEERMTVFTQKAYHRLQRRCIGAKRRDTRLRHRETCLTSDGWLKRMNRLTRLQGGAAFNGELHSRRTAAWRWLAACWWKTALTPFATKFNGNPAKYLTFMSHHQVNVEPEVRSAGKRLQWLLSNVSGEAWQLIHTCSWTDNDKGLEKALKLLKKNYGEDHRIANSYLRKLIEGPKIKQFDAKAIIGLSNEMENCKSLLEGLSLASNLNTPGAVKMIARRLPHHLLLKWTSKFVLHQPAEATGRDLRTCGSSSKNRPTKSTRPTWRSCMKR